MKLLIIEDEVRAANRIERLLLEINPELTILGKLESISEALVFLKDHSPDAIISDIQLADGLSFEIFQQIDVNCPIIFTTAYDQYAIQAFETNGIDYLLKPIETERLEKALAKINRLSTPTILPSNLVTLLQSSLHQGESKTYKSRFMIKVGDKFKAIPTEEIKAFYSLEKGSYLLTKQNRNYVVEYSLEQLMGLLNPTDFFRVNRNFIVHIDAPETIIAHTNSRLKLVVNGYEGEPIIVAREKVQDFKTWLDQ